MNIGEASKASGVLAKMIRYYENTGLIPVAARTELGYRAQARNDAHRLGLIRRARDLGFCVIEISLWSDHARRSADVKRLAKDHIAALGIGLQVCGKWQTPCMCWLTAAPATSGLIVRLWLTSNVTMRAM